MEIKKESRQVRYDRKAMKHYGLKFHLVNDSDIINWLDSQPNKQAAVKQLIRNEIAKTGYDRKQSD